MARMIFLFSVVVVFGALGRLYGKRFFIRIIRRWVKQGAAKTISRAKQVFMILHPDQSFRMTHHFQSGLSALEYSVMDLFGVLEKNSSVSEIFWRALLAHKSWTMLDRSLMDFGRLYFGRISEIEFHIRMKGLYFSHCCYLCSKPLILPFVNRAKLITENRCLTVRACSICRTSLKKSSKAQILYFFQQGRRLHWMEMEESTPAVRYWNVNG